MVWKWFWFNASDEQQITPRCEVCLEAVATKGSATTNLFQHLKQSHSAEREQCVALWAAGARDASPKTAAPKQVIFARLHFHMAPHTTGKGPSGNKLRTKDIVPIYTVEKLGFVSMLRVIDARYELPSRKFFAEVALPHLYTLYLVLF